MSQSAEHWEATYTKKRPDEVSWYRPHLETSLSFLEKAGVAKDAGILDVGGGASTFVDDVVARGYSKVTVIDLSSAALETARSRLGERGRSVHWLLGDITRLELPRHEYAFWHDRAVFHFLREPEERSHYVSAVQRGLVPGGHIMVATFGPGGPERCSGLDVSRYSADELHAQFGGEFEKVESQVELHTTPGGSLQEFVYCLCRLQPSCASSRP